MDDLDLGWEVWVSIIVMALCIWIGVANKPADDPNNSENVHTVIVDGKSVKCVEDGWGSLECDFANAKERAK